MIGTRGGHHAMGLTIDFTGQGTIRFFNPNEGLFEGGIGDFTSDLRAEAEWPDDAGLSFQRVLI